MQHFVLIEPSFEQAKTCFESIDKSDGIICFDLLRHALNKFELVFKKCDAIVLPYCIIFKQV
jgi:hypothetical protein